MNRSHKRLATSLFLVPACAGAQLLTEWVENNPAADPTKLALGYPTPIPVDTPLPFDGFRTYAGLHMRHQDLAVTTPWVHGHEIGTTLNGRTIWAYRLGDEDKQTAYGFPEPATLTNGGIHAREWQTPEVVTGILELMATYPNDNHFYDYLRDNVNMIVIPSLNIDGFLQTQRFPTQNYLQSDPNSPNTSPRDGRMRRKNMLGADENLLTVIDHLRGVDLNRNNAPYWSTDPGRSSPDINSLVHHGSNPQSEPETRALDVAAELGPAEQLRIYTDVHSFSQVHFWDNGNNTRLNALTARVLNQFTDHHAAFPAGKNYFAVPPATNVGIGTTSEYFFAGYQVPSWTLEVEPSGGQAFHPNLPGAGGDYGGVVTNGHDGFILPESQIRRVREELAQSFAAVFYQQAGPASIKAWRIFDAETGAMIYEAEWDRVDDRNRELFVNQIQPLQLAHDYIAWVAYDKPMRWMENGEIAPFPGQNPGFLATFGGSYVDDQALDIKDLEAFWLNEPGRAPDGYLNYAFDAEKFEIRFFRNSHNGPLVNGETVANTRTTTWDMSSSVPDADPSTVAYWDNGYWINYENSRGEQSDTGGEDSSYFWTITDEELPPPFLLEPGTAAAWGDPDRNGEGFILEMLSDTTAVMFWFTNDDEGGQDWYIGVGNIRGNRIVFPRVLRVSGGEFGSGFDPELVTEEVVGSARFVWSGCDNGTMDWNIGARHGRQTLIRLTSLMGMECGQPVMGAAVHENALFSGSWGDPSHDGEGYTVEILPDGSALVFWFSFGPDGKRRWYFGIGTLLDGKYVFENMLTTTGGVFGKEFDPADVDEVHWGRLELELSCAGGTATYTPVEAGFDAGQQSIGKITNMNGLECTP
jgi:hypothetical protein